MLYLLPLCQYEESHTACSYSMHYLLSPCSKSAMTPLTGCWAIIHKAVNRKERNGEFHCQSLIRGMCLPCYIQVSSKYILSYSDLSSFLEVSLTFLSIFITLMAMSQREYIVHDSKKSITTCMIMIENYILSIS